MAWKWAAASRRGTSHVRAGTRCQDASRTLLVGQNRDVLVLIASDGAGSAAFGGEGAVLVCRVVSELARDHFARSAALPSEEHVRGWLDAVRDRIGVAAAGRAAELRDFAATLVAAIATPDRTLLLHIGDGAIVVERAGTWLVGSWPAAGEYASMTYFVTDEPSPDLRVQLMEETPDALAVFTDGIERLVLDFASREPHSPFFQSMIRSVRSSDASGRDARLCGALAAYLDTDAVNARTDDDKTLILAART